MQMGDRCGYNMPADTWTLVLKYNSFAVDFSFSELVYVISWNEGRGSKSLKKIPLGRSRGIFLCD